MFKSAILAVSIPALLAAPFVAYQYAKPAQEQTILVQPVMSNAAPVITQQAPPIKNQQPPSPPPNGLPTVLFASITNQQNCNWLPSLSGIPLNYIGSPVPTWQSDPIPIILTPFVNGLVPPSGFQSFTIRFDTNMAGNYSIQLFVGSIGSGNPATGTSQPFLYQSKLALPWPSILVTGSPAGEATIVVTQ